MGRGVNRLLDASLAPNTSAAYRTALGAFQQFLRAFSLPNIYPITPNQLVLFISYCFEKNLSPNTINTYVAGVNHMHKLHGFPDLRESFLVKKVMEGCFKLRKAKDVRLPITITILTDISAILPDICYDAYETLLFRAALLLAFFGLFRVSEIVVPSCINVNRSLLRDDVRLDGQGKYIFVTLRITKNNQNGRPTTLKISSESDVALCPFRAIEMFLIHRPSISGPFFCHADRTPVTRSQFSAVLARCISRVRPGCVGIKSHSFRIGRASQLAALGLSEEKIRVLGRWHSGAFRTYIRN